MAKRILNVERIVSLSSDPASAEGGIYYNSVTKKLKYHDGTSWTDIASASGTTGQTASATPPGSPNLGDIWFDTTTGKTYVYYDSFWIEVGTSEGGRPLVLSGDVTGTGTDNIATTLGPSGVIAGTYGSALQVPIFDVDVKGRITGASSVGVGSVTSVGLSTPVGLTVSGSPVTTTGTLAIALQTGYSIPTTASQTNWDTAFTQSRQWDGGATSLVAATGRTSLGSTTVGSNLFTLTNPSAITFLQVNANNTVSALNAASFRTAIGAGTSSTVGTVTSVAMTVPTGLSITGTPITSAGTFAVSLQSGYSIPTTASQANWDTAFSERAQWDGGATNLVAATGRTSLGGTTIGQSIFTLTNPSAITFLQVNANNTVSALSAASFRTAIGAGTSSTVGTVTSVAMTVPTGLSISGTPITASGTLALTLTAGYVIPTSASLALLAPLASPTFTGTLTTPLTTAGYVTTTAGGVLGSVATIPNAGLTNSSVTIGSTSVSLGATVTTFAGLTSVTSTTFVGSLTGNASTATSATDSTNVAITNDTTTAATMYPTWVTATTGNLPTKTSSTKLTFTPSTGTLAATEFSGSGASLTSIPNGALTNSSVTIGSTAVSLGSTVTTFAGMTLTTPVINAINGSAVSTAATGWANITTGSIAIGGGLTTGALNLATGGTSATPITIGHTNATIALIGNTTVTGFVDASVSFRGQASDLVTTPSFTWTGDTTTGLYRPAASQIGVTIAGTQRGLFSATGLAVTGTISATGLAGSLLTSTVGSTPGTAAAGSSAIPARSDHVHPREVAVQTGNSGLFLTTNGSATSWAAVIGSVYQASAPGTPSTGAIWVDSDTDVLYIYNGSTWHSPMGTEQNARTASYTLVLTDRSKLVEMSVAGANTLTVPPNSTAAFPIGTQITIAQTGAGQTTITPGAAVTINGTPGLKLRTQWSTATLIKRATDTWLAFGDLIA